MTQLNGLVTVREIFEVLRRWQARTLAGESGMGRSVTWAVPMRARLPAFEGFQGGEVALLSLSMLRTLRGQLGSLSLPAVVDQLAEIGASAVVVVGVREDAPEGELPQARARADARRLPLLALPAGVALPEIEREIIAYVVARRGRSAATLPAPDAYAARLHASLRGEALEALLTGTYAGEAQMRARAAQLGYDLTQPHVALWVELGEDGDEAPPGAATLATRLAEELEVACGAWARVRGAAVVALLPAAPEPGILDVQARVRPLLEGLPQRRWSAGLGEPASAPAQVRRSATEAHDAAHLGRFVLGPAHLARSADLGIYRLLLSLRESGELGPFVARTLAPLRADARAGDALVETLDAFFACNGNLSQAARRLHLHRNSLLYRLHRAREVLGHDLDDPELRLALQLAIKGQRVLDL